MEANSGEPVARGVFNQSKYNEGKKVSKYPPGYIPMTHHQFTPATGGGRSGQNEGGGRTATKSNKSSPNRSRTNSNRSSAPRNNRKRTRTNDSSDSE